MKKIIMLVAAVAMMMPVCAQKSMREYFLSMPDSISTGLNESLRKELVDYARMGVEAKVKNLFQGTTRLDTINNEYVSVRLNEAAMMQMRMLHDITISDSVICVVKTFMAPEAESEVRFYSLDWKQKNTSYGLPKFETDSIVYEFVERPDTMPVWKFEELCRMIEPVMVTAELSPADETITFALSTPLLNSDEKRDVEAILRPRKYCWNGVSLKKCY